MTFQIVKGNLFDQDRFQFDALAQGTNCKGVMGAGIAVAFRNNYPLMYAAYQKLCKDFPDVLPGLMQFYYHETVEIRQERVSMKDGPFAGMSWTVPVYDGLPHVYNLFTQESPGRGNARIKYVETSALLMRHHAEEQDFQEIGLPWIGAGIGGLEKHNVEHIFRRILSDSPVNFTLVEQ